MSPRERGWWGPFEALLFRARSPWSRAFRLLSVRHDRRAGDMALVLLDERLVDLLERELVRNHPTPRVLVERAPHEVEGAAEVLGLVVREADDPPVAEDDPRRIELGLPAHVDVADLEVGALRRRHAQALLDHAWMADQLQHHVAPQSSVAFLTAAIRSAGVECRRMSTTSVAPN